MRLLYYTFLVTFRFICGHLIYISVDEDRSIPRRSTLVMLLLYVTIWNKMERIRFTPSLIHCYFIYLSALIQPFSHGPTYIRICRSMLSAVSRWLKGRRECVCVRWGGGGGGGGWERAEQITQTQLQTRVIQVSVVVCRLVCYVNRAILLPFVLGWPCAVDWTLNIIITK